MKTPTYKSGIKWILKFSNIPVWSRRMHWLMLAIDSFRICLVVISRLTFKSIKTENTPVELIGGAILNGPKLFH